MPRDMHVDDSTDTFLIVRCIVINLSVCLSVCLSASMFLEPLGRSSWIFMQIPCDRGSVLLRQRCDTLCTSGFTDDVTFDRSGPCEHART